MVAGVHLSLQRSRNIRESEVVRVCMCVYVYLCVHFHCGTRYCAGVLELVWRGKWLPAIQAGEGDKEFQCSGKFCKAVSLDVQFHAARTEMTIAAYCVLLLSSI